MAEPPFRGRVLRRLSVSEDVAREIQSHIDLRTEELVAQGWERSAAEQEAVRLFGDRAGVSLACTEIATRHERALGRAMMIEAGWQDIRYAVRSLWKSPGFAIVAILTLALGIGANTAVFSVVNSVLLQPLPYDRPEEIVSILEKGSRGGGMQVAWANFRDWEAESGSFDALAAYNVGLTTVLGGAEPVQAIVARVTEDFWDVFAVPALEGRLSASLDHAEGAEPVVVVSDGFWRNQLAGQPLDQLALEIGPSRARVIGVVSGLDFPIGTDVWGAITPADQSLSRTAHNYRVVARTRRGVSREQAAEEVDALTLAIVLREADEDPDFLASGSLTVPLQEELVGDVRSTLFLLLGAAGLVLLVACTNLASTLLARGTVRAPELAVRLSLGAAKGRVVRQLLTESLVLSSLGAAVGVAFAWIVIRTVRLAARSALPGMEAVSIDGWVLAYTALTAVLTALAFGLLPAVKLTTRSAGDALRQGSRGNSVEARAPIWRLLVGTEVALAVMLLMASGLLGRSFQRLMAEDIGIDAADVATMPVSLSLLKYEDEYDHARFYDELLAEVVALPAVASAGILSSLPLTGFLPNGRLELDGDLNNTTIANYVVASSGAFEALDVPLLQGRLFSERDLPDAEHVAIVSRSFAERSWPGVDPVGRYVTGGGMDNFWEVRTFARVVGVVGDVSYRSLGSDDGPTVYFPHSQRPFRIQYGASLVVEAARGEPESLAPALRSTVRALDPDIPVRIRTQAEVMADSVSARRFLLVLFGAFSVLGLVLASVGIYGVVSYSVARRAREVGIRVALGADPGSVVALVVKAAMRMVGGGLVVGILGSLLLARLIAGLLHEISPADPATLLGVVLVLSGAAFLASWLPARRTARVDPIAAIRSE